MQEQTQAAARVRARPPARHFLLCAVLTALLLTPARQIAAQAQQTSRGVPAATPDFVPAVRRILPSVVAVSCLRILSAQDLQLYRERRPRDRGREFEPPPELQQRSTGAGLIISADGHVLTNTHVVEFADKITVTLHDQRTFPAQVLGADPLSEIAVLKIAATGLQPAVLGNSQATQVGEWVLAVGNPLELRFTVTAGIVSAKGRQLNVIQESFGVEYFLQTDAAINPGNSGGGLFNLNGEAIGLITAIATETGYDVGLGFAVPIDLAMRIAADLMRSGKVVRGYLGVVLRPVKELEARALGLTVPTGVFIDDLYAGSPAELAGLQPADVILRIDGVPVKQTNEVQARIAALKPGTRITLEIFREQRVLTVRARLAELPANETLSPPPGPLPAFENQGIQAVNLGSLEESDLRKPWRGGVKVTAVARYSPAEQAGLMVDDIIVAVNRQPVHTTGELAEQLRRFAAGSAVMLAVLRAAGLYHLFLEVY
ncbi:MAG: trypsin-like peptidase domain-containing protein [candidate division KSB1 bacterium]|nr:trypsin-like peptidase domain-containing protein [candidate division KSB1 bacterium]MDZ7273101.1 trypsin-like peptidase domain-containing protein [candidate division KSB1 bacterium]MDZ7285203.1 trypsin-like peptidase domain-containing protein [candidate division KSB1 bacterium]MDZ7298235.1 trypsin-like peptidase domain-containing protein [candidate division KSB1 bacterium]MDZ7306737.1 trypsin-like peptidase domain-containing protein [candidate division KSB1 bacterium]